MSSLSSLDDEGASVDEILCTCFPGFLHLLCKVISSSTLTASVTPCWAPSFLKRVNSTTKEGGFLWLNVFVIPVRFSLAALMTRFFTFFFYSVDIHRCLCTWDNLHLLCIRFRAPADVNVLVKYELSFLRKSFFLFAGLGFRTPTCHPLKLFQNVSLLLLGYQWHHWESHKSKKKVYSSLIHFTDWKEILS